MSAGGSLADATQVGDGTSEITVKIEINGVQKHLLIEHGLDPSFPDNRIIGAAPSADAGGLRRASPTMLRCASKLHTSAFRPKSIGPSGEACRPGPVDGARTRRRTRPSIVRTQARRSTSGRCRREQLHENGFAVLRAGSQSALASSRR